MTVKRIILSVFDRDDLKSVIDEFEIDEVDRRSADVMRSKISRMRRATPEVLLGFLNKDGLKQICKEMDLKVNGRKDELISRVLNGNGKKTQARLGENIMSQTTEQQQIPFKPESENGKRKKKPERLTLARLERKLLEACDILRGNMDASEFKEYIFGMLFLKRMSDQFDDDKETLRKELADKGMKPSLIKKQLENPKKFDFFVPPEAHWDNIKHLKESVGDGLNKALAAMEEANISRLEDVLKSINYNQKVGKKPIDDSTLVEFIDHFNSIPLSNDDFEFPDLLGAAYEYLIKYFADTAGKKAGEFYTPSEVVRMMVQVVEPDAGMSILDPCVGSGGMLIQSHQYVLERGHDAKDLFLAGQDSEGTPWKICKMNMILHSIRSADIRHADTLKNPQHLDDKGEIKRFDRVLANPPFAKNYTKKEMKFPERFHTFMPEKGKKADLMFVQHMVSSLKTNGKMAVVMPHGVLFRGGEEKACRQRFIKDGILEAIIGMPPSLFYGTGIPASVLVINKAGASKRDAVLFINADREYKDNKNQNSLRPEDIQKITNVYRNRLEVEKYSRIVPVAEIEAEDFNLNIRRYVDNSPPPEPHDVRAHLNGGVPVVEIDALSPYFDNYAGLRDLLFKDRDQNYDVFADAITGKDAIEPLIESANGVQEKHEQFHAALDAWWKEHVGEIESLPETGNVFDLRAVLLGNISDALTPQNILTTHQIRGGLAAYMKSLEADFKSIAASGWGPELIPDEEILQSQFPEVLEKSEQDKARIAELEALFAAADDEDAEEDDESGVLPSDQVKAYKHERKEINNKSWDHCKSMKRRISDLFKALKRDDLIERGDKVGTYTEGLKQAEQNFVIASKILSLPNLNGKYTEFTDDIRHHQHEGGQLRERHEQIDERLATHEGLAKELKEKKANVKEVEKQKDELVAKAREKISDEEAKELILERLQRLLTERFDGYLRQCQRELIAEIENLWNKYAVTTKEILKDRDIEATQLEVFLKELGYE